jgi:transcriptional regulator with XRE-family HTH domain
LVYLLNSYVCFSKLYEYKYINNNESIVKITKVFINNNPVHNMKNNKKTIGERVLELRSYYGLSQTEFAHRCKLTPVAILNLEKGQVKNPRESSIQSMATVYGSTTEWLLHGEGEMLPNGIKEFTAEGAPTLANPWKDEAYAEVKSKNDFLQKEVDRLWAMIQHLTGGAKPNFLRALSNAGDFEEESRLRAAA